MSKDYQEINDRIIEVTHRHWASCFQFQEDGTIAIGKQRQYRHDLLLGVFSTLIKDFSVMSLDEPSGLYPVLLARAGAASVSANYCDTVRKELIEAVADAAGLEVNLIQGSQIYYNESKIYLNANYQSEWDFLFGQGTVWKYYYSFEKNFDFLVEACAYYVKEGLIFEWESADWADPPVPPQYNLQALCTALRKRFAYVIAIEKGFVVAMGKLPVRSEASQKDLVAS